MYDVLGRKVNNSNEERQSGVYFVVQPDGKIKRVIILK